MSSTVIQERQTKAFRRVLDILEEKRDIRNTIMDASEQERLLDARSSLTEKYYEHIGDIRKKYNNWISEGKVNELEYFRICEDYRRLLREEYEVRFCLKS